jgi:hypothetical protein
MDVPAPHGRTAEPTWPSLSAADLRRLHFLAYLRLTGRIRPPAPIRPAVDALCTALFRAPPAPRATIGERPNAYHGGLPPLWQAWAAKQARKLDSTG